MIVYKSKLVFLSDRFSNYELNVLHYLNKQNKVIVYGQLSIKNIVDDGLVENVHNISFFTYNDGIKEEQEFVVVLTQKGKEFIEKWIDPLNNEFSYED